MATVNPLFNNKLLCVYNYLLKSELTVGIFMFSTFFNGFVIFFKSSLGDLPHDIFFSEKKSC